MWHFPSLCGCFYGLQFVTKNVVFSVTYISSPNVIKLNKHAVDKSYFVEYSENLTKFV